MTQLTGNAADTLQIGNKSSYNSGIYCYQQGNGNAIAATSSGAGICVYAWNTSTGAAIVASGNAGVGISAGSTSNDAIDATVTTTNAVKGTATTGTGIRGLATIGNGVAGASSDSANGNGVYGTSAASGGSGVYGVNTNLTSGSAIYGVCNATNGYGISGSGSGTNGTGVYGYSNGGTNSNGVYGYATGGTGVYAYSSSGGCGVLAKSPSVTGYGVYCSGGAYSLYATSAAYVGGYLTKAGGGYRVDHPTDPENKFLNHCFVESPEMKNVYDGVSTLDTSGVAVIKMPSYFEAANSDYRYQLTAIGAAMPDLHVASEMANGQFTVAGGKAGMKVSWQVTGVRADKWALANHPGVEITKKPEEKGKYMHPELFGKDKTFSLNEKA